MEIFRTPAELQAYALSNKRAGRTIALVPTMGYLHAGHCSLIDIARQKADLVIVSIFVNPIQFGPSEDLDKYPRDFEHDAKLCTEHGADAVFAPEPGVMYAPDASTVVEEQKLSRPLCGARRPGPLPRRDDGGCEAFQSGAAGLRGVRHEGRPAAAGHQADGARSEFSG